MDISKLSLQELYEYFLNAVNYEHADLVAILSILNRIEKHQKLPDFINYLHLQNFQFTKPLKIIYYDQELDEEENAEHRLFDLKFLEILEEFNYSLPKHEFIYLTFLLEILKGDHILEYFLKRNVNLDFRKSFGTVKKTEVIFRYLKLEDFIYLVKYYGIDIHQLFLDYNLYHYVYHHEDYVNYLFEQGVDIYRNLEKMNLKNDKNEQNNILIYHRPPVQDYYIIYEILLNKIDLYKLPDQIIYWLIAKKDNHANLKLIERILSIENLDIDYFHIFLRYYLVDEFDEIKSILEKYALKKLDPNYLMQILVDMKVAPLKDRIDRIKRLDFLKIYHIDFQNEKFKYILELKGKIDIKNKYYLIYHVEAFYAIMKLFENIWLEEYQEEMIEMVEEMIEKGVEFKIKFEKEKKLLNRVKMENCINRGVLYNELVR